MRTDTFCVVHTQKDDHRSESLWVSRAGWYRPVWKVSSGLWVAGTAVSLRCCSFLKHMFCCERASAETTRARGWSTSACPLVFCSFQSSRGVCFLRVCQRTIIQKTPSCLFFSFTHHFSSTDFCKSIFYMLERYIVINTVMSSSDYLSIKNRKMGIQNSALFVSGDIRKKRPLYQDGWFWMCLLVQDGKCEC